MIRRTENDWFIFYSREKDPDVMWNLSYDTSEDICKLKPELMSSLPDLPPPLCRTPAIQIASCSQAHNTSRRNGYCVSICEHKLPRSIFSIVTAMSPDLAWHCIWYMIVPAKTLNLTLMTVGGAYHLWWQFGCKPWTPNPNYLIVSIHIPEKIFSFSCYRQFHLSPPRFECIRAPSWRQSSELRDRGFCHVLDTW